MLAIVHAGQLVTLRGPAGPRRGAALRDLGIIEDGAVLCEDGVITAVGRTDELRRRIPDGARVINALGRPVLPGFVDAHTHLVFAGHRADDFEARARGDSYLDIAARGGGILHTVRLTRATRDGALFAGARRRAWQMLRNGTTTAEAKSGYGLSLESELTLLRVIRRLHREGPLRLHATFLGAHAVPPEFAGRADDYVDEVVGRMLPEVAERGLATWCDVFCDRGAFTVAQARRVLLAARGLGLGVRAHVDQLTPDWGGAALAAELRLATADHLEMTDEAGITALAAAGVTPVLLPGSVYALGHQRYPAARAMIEAGLPIVLATDLNPGSSPTPSVPMVLSLAVTQMRLLPAEAITAATINAAHALGLASEVGSLEPGKRADLVIHDCEDVRELAVSFGCDTAHTVVVDGRVVFSRGRD